MALETMKPFVVLEIAAERVRKIEELWNTRDPERVVLAYTLDAEWCSCNERLSGRDAIKDFLRRKWTSKLGYRVRKELWAVHSNRVVVSVAFGVALRRRPMVQVKGCRATGVTRERSD